MSTILSDVADICVSQANLPRAYKQQNLTYDDSQ